MSELDTLRDKVAAEHTRAQELLQHWTGRLEEANAQIQEWQKAARDATLNKTAYQVDINRLGWLLAQLPQQKEAEQPPAS